MIRIGGKIPIIITPAFWIFAAVIGFLSSMSVIGTLIWIGIIFISVLFHELGHAVTALFFGQKPHIELVAMGGMTFHNAEKLSFWKQFIIVFNGPLFGFFLFLGAGILLGIPSFNQGLVGAVLSTLKWVNLFWTVLNLLPILPLDGGQLLRIPLEAFFGLKGLRYTLLISMIIAFAISLAAFLFQYFLIGAILFFFAFQSFDQWKKSRTLSTSDQDINLKDLLVKGEQALQAGDKEKAKSIFMLLRNQASKGMHHLLATQYLAFLYYEVSDYATVYQLLHPIQDQISIDALCLLHRAAFENQDYALVDTLAGRCYQQIPNVEIALHSSFAAARLHHATASLGWLDAARHNGLQHIKEILLSPHFDPIRQDPAFRNYQEDIDGYH